MLSLHHLRNATMVIETEKDVILVDPMLGLKGTLPTFTFFRFKAQKNPIVHLPEKCSEILKKITHCIITHQHPDHIDKEGLRFLKKNNIPITCSVKDEKAFKKKELNIVNVINYWKKNDFLGGTIEGIPAKHGYGFISKPMGNVMGFYIELPNQKSIYISADTVYTDAVDKVLKTYKPNISIVASGTAQLDIFKPLLMTMADILKFVKNSPDIVIANHLEAVNHCPTTRKKLREELEKHKLSYKVEIPIDGEIIKID
ncbi:MAG: MBL fold metallo-hydrolase [Saprospiraceae bacterium]